MVNVRFFEKSRAEWVTSYVSTILPNEDVSRRRVSSIFAAPPIPLPSLSFPHSLFYDKDKRFDLSIFFVLLMSICHLGGSLWLMDFGGGRKEGN